MGVSWATSREEDSNDRETEVVFSFCRSQKLKTKGISHTKYSLWGRSTKAVRGKVLLHCLQVGDCWKWRQSLVSQQENHRPTNLWHRPTLPSTMQSCHPLCSGCSFIDFLFHWYAPISLINRPCFGHSKSQQTQATTHLCRENFSEREIIFVECTKIRANIILQREQN